MDLVNITRVCKVIFNSCPTSLLTIDLSRGQKGTETHRILQLSNMSLKCHVHAAYMITLEEK